MTGVSFRWGKRMEGLIAGLSRRLDAYDAAAAKAKAKRDERWLRINDRIDDVEARVARAEAKTVEAKGQALRALHTAASAGPARKPWEPYEPTWTAKWPEVRDLKCRMDEVEARLDQGVGRAFVQGMLVGAAALLAGMFFGLYLFK